MGTLAMAVPKQRRPRMVASSSILVGNRNEISARMFAEYVAAKKGKIAMVSVYLDKMTEMDAQGYFKKLIEKVIAVEKKTAEKVA
jgi:acetyl/propionyl-CoA carboxylase alpha subunit